MFAAAAFLLPAVASGADINSGDLIAHQPNLKVRVNYCHRYYLKRGGDTEGKVSFSVQVDSAGKVVGMLVTERTVGEDGLVECIGRALRNTTYNVSQATTFSLPIVFAAVNDDVADLAANW